MHNRITEMDHAQLAQENTNKTEPASLPGSMQEHLDALAVKEPFLRPICHHLAELVIMGRKDSHSAARLLDYIIASRPIEEADFWRGLIA